MIILHCGLQAWNSGHKSECKKIRNNEDSSEVIIKLDPPIPEEDGRVSSTCTYENIAQGESASRCEIFSKAKNAKSYCLPDVIEVKQPFWLKVQVTGGSEAAHLCYDKSRTLRFSLENTQAGYMELRETVCASGALGRKGHFEAHVSADGELFLNLSKMTIKTW